MLIDVVYALASLNRAVRCLRMKFPLLLSFDDKKSEKEITVLPCSMALRRLTPANPTI